jgi:rhodanese-related sulfurtransferase
VASLGDLARARLAEVDQILRDAGADCTSDERVTRGELIEKVRNGDVVVLDVRPLAEYEAGHIPGALSVPLEHLEAHFGLLDPALEIVAYCRGPLCLLAPQAVSALRSRGFRAQCLQDGMPEWRLAGLPTVSGAD